MTDLAIFTPSLEGGIGRFVVNLAREFMARGYVVDVVTIKTGPRDIPHEGVSITDLRTGRTFRSLFSLVSYLKEKKPRALLSALFHANLVAIFAKILSGSNTRVVVTEHVALKEELKRQPILKRWMFKFFINFFYPKAFKVTAGSVGVKDDLMYVGVPDKKIEVIYYPIINQELFKSAEGEVDEKWLNNSQIPVVLAIGRLTEQKDFSTLIKAFNLALKIVEAKLIIIGDGYEKPNLVKLIADSVLNDKIFLLGHKQNHYPYFKKANLFVLSSKYEGLGIVLVEALALGVPVVSTDCPSGPSEVLKGGARGILVPVGDETALSAAIIESLVNPKIKKEQINLEEFTSTNSGAHYEQILFLKT
jgi:glycosyltransferase involved in cell wall biosynthesis